MKLRIRGNSLRLRLTQSEVMRIGRGEAVEDSVTFTPSQSLRYAIQPSREVQKISSRLEGSLISVLIPRDEALDWSRSDETALMADQAIYGEVSLKLLIEKDFACLKPRQNESEDESDLFPNPNVAHGSCGGHE